ncbi:MAG: IPExxxVDY family protein [Bacteroidota bacterium]|nr:IPExxxVDY family protein [Bacteroidota bacterium]
MKKLQLEVEEDLSFLLFGLVSNHKASKLLFFLNQVESLNFERVADLDLPDYNPKSEISFSKFAYFDEENHLDFYLLANKEFGLCLFNDLKQFDYLLIVRGGIEFFDEKMFTRSCMQLSGIQFMAPIANPKILSKISWII